MNLRGKGPANATFGATGLSLIAVGAAWLLWTRYQQGADAPGLLAGLASIGFLSLLVGMPFILLWWRTPQRWWIALPTGAALLVNLLWWPIEFLKIADTSSTAGLLIFYWVPLGYLILLVGLLLDEILGAVGRYRRGESPRWQAASPTNCRWGIAGCGLGALAGVGVTVTLVVQEGAGLPGLIAASAVGMLLAMAISLPFMFLLQGPAGKALARALGVLMLCNAGLWLAVLSTQEADIQVLAPLGMFVGGFVIRYGGILVERRAG